MNNLQGSDGYAESQTATNYHIRKFLCRAPLDQHQRCQAELQHTEAVLHQQPPLSHTTISPNQSMLNSVCKRIEPQSNGPALLSVRKQRWKLQMIEELWELVFEPALAEAYVLRKPSYDILGSEHQRPNNR